jgi:DNA transformation protein and related proteins
MDEAWLHDLFAPVGPIAVRRMFGGIGVYSDGAMFALVADDVLYMKADDETRAAFEAAGSHPFTYGGKGRPVRTSYWRLPDSALDEPDDLKTWADLAVKAALRSRKPERARTRRRSS